MLEGVVSKELVDDWAVGDSPVAFSCVGVLPCLLGVDSTYFQVSVDASTYGRRQLEGRME